MIVGQVPGQRPRIQDVAAHIKESTGGRIDILVATHQHWDHLSGFVDAKDVFQQIEIGQVWFAWTENPQDSLAKQLNTKKAKSASSPPKGISAYDRKCKNISRSCRRWTVRNRT